MPLDTMVVRDETVQDHAAVYEIISAAFGRSDEAELVNRLRYLTGIISLVAELNGSIIGHIMFSPVRLIQDGMEVEDAHIAGLAPVSVFPSHQKTGVGKTLIQAGLNRCIESGYVACVLLGNPDYYPKFGFQPALPTFGIRSNYNVPDPVFMALELVDGSLKGKRGTIYYHPTFLGV